MYQDTAAEVPFCGLFLRRLVSSRVVKMFSQETQLQMWQTTRPTFRQCFTNQCTLRQTT